jgi:cobalamin biosynthesis Mg chelatase CobN
VIRSGKTLSFEVDVDTTATVDVDIDDLIRDLEEHGYRVLKAAEGDSKDVAERMFECYRRGDLDGLENALVDYFDAALGRIAGDAPWRMRRAA